MAKHAQRRDLGMADDEHRGHGYVGSVGHLCIRYAVHAYMHEKQYRIL